ncbi:MAG: hypothetical protein Q8P01_01055 [bacterium]|nr:hypothetical protein [bacterium]
MARLHLYLNPDRFLSGKEAPPLAFAKATDGHSACVVNLNCIVRAASMPT